MCLTYYLLTLEIGIYHVTRALEYVRMGHHVLSAVLKVLYHSYKEKILMLCKLTASSIEKYLFQKQYQMNKSSFKASC